MDTKTSRFVNNNICEDIVNAVLCVLCNYLIGILGYVITIKGYRLHD